MERKEFNQRTESAALQNETMAGNQPGQQLPANAEQTGQSGTAGEAVKEQHSESSFPREDGETLGTP